jgi:ribosome-binding protein aMBF1 (putative translation factor)
VTFDPLGDAGDFPADPDTIRTYGEDVAATGQLIELQVVQLRALADGDSWVADSADAFRDKAEELAGQISRSSDRHVAVGAELKVLADDMADYERRAASKATSAREQVRIIAANPPAQAEPSPDGGPAQLTPEGERQNARRRAAEDALAQLQRDFDELARDAREAAGATARRISSALEDGVKDDFFDRNAGWLEVAGQVLGAIGAAAAILLLTVATLGTVWLVVALAAGVAALVISVGLALKADGSWTQVALDAVSVLTLGVGGVALRALTKGFPAVRSAVAAFRGSRAFTASMNRFWGVPLRFHSWRASWAFDLAGMRSSSLVSLGRMGDEALRAADAAVDATLRTFPVTRVQRFVDGGIASSRTIRQSREMLESLRAVDDVPGRLLQDATLLARYARVATLAPNLGVLADGTQLAMELPHVDSVTGVRILTDVIGRLR